MSSKYYNYLIPCFILGLIFCLIFFKLSKPDIGFRGLKLGSNISENPNLILQDTYIPSTEIVETNKIFLMNVYTKKNEVLIFDNLPIRHIYYHYYKNRLSAVFLMGKGKTNVNLYIKALEKRYGKPYLSNQVDNTGNKFFIWSSPNVEVELHPVMDSLLYYISYSSKTLLKEQKGDEKRVLRNQKYL